MKLTTQDTSNLFSILMTCAVGGIESIIIEDGLVRGVNEARTFVILSRDAVPNFPQKIGLSRLSALKQRLQLFAGNPATIIEAKETDRGEISSIDISAGKAKAQFRCTSTMLIKAPKSINDDPAFKVTLSKAEMKTVLEAIKVMGGKQVQLIIKKDHGVQIHISDATNDVFQLALETSAEPQNDVEQDSVVHYYHPDIFHSTMKAIPDEETVTFTVGNVGTIRVRINGHSVTLMPKINENSEGEE